VTEQPLERTPRQTAPAEAQAAASAGPAERYQRLPSGGHGLDPEQVRGDQAQRLRAAMIELIAAKGYPAVRIADLSKLAHVSPPTLYSLYADKEQLFLGTYEDVARRTVVAILDAHRTSDSPDGRLLAVMEAFADLAAREPEAISLLVLGAFGAGPKLLGKRAAAVEALEAYIHSNRSPDEPFDPRDLTVRAVLGGIREVTAARLREGRQQELPTLAGELAAWADCYPRRLPEELLAPVAGAKQGPCKIVSERAQQAQHRLPSGRSDLPREAIEKSQRERIVDATAAIAAEKGLAALTIPEIAKRANISNQTFYAIYPSKNDAFLGAQKVGMHQALGVALSAYETHGDDWPRAVAAGIAALLEYLASEPAHAHLTLVDTFAANPEAIRIRQDGMASFRAYLMPGFALAGAERSRAGSEVIAEAVAGGIWQVLHHYIDKDSAAALPGAAPQLAYFALAPFLGAEQAAAVALEG
jgi:AcrR family transcriptional regulator